MELFICGFEPSAGNETIPQVPNYAAGAPGPEGPAGPAGADGSGAPPLVNSFRALQAGFPGIQLIKYVIPYTLFAAGASNDVSLLIDTVPPGVTVVSITMIVDTVFAAPGIGTCVISMGHAGSVNDLFFNKNGLATTVSTVTPSGGVPADLGGAGVALNIDYFSDASSQNLTAGSIRILVAAINSNGI